MAVTDRQYTMNRCQQGAQEECLAHSLGFVGPIKTCALQMVSFGSSLQVEPLTPYKKLHSAEMSSPGWSCSASSADTERAGGSPLFPWGICPARIHNVMGKRLSIHTWDQQRVSMTRCVRLYMGQ